jgi:hypothetical protein
MRAAEAIQLQKIIDFGWFCARQAKNIKVAECTFYTRMHCPWSDYMNRFQFSLIQAVWERLKNKNSNTAIGSLNKL